jgi:hypothetical protein
MDWAPVNSTAPVKIKHKRKYRIIFTGIYDLQDNKNIIHRQDA